MPTNSLTRFARDEDGVVAVIVSLLLTVLLGFTALGVDAAWLYRERARLQTVADLTADSAMATPKTATARASYVLVRNGKSDKTLQTVDLGRYLRNPAIPPKDRFTILPAGSTGINAVRIAVQDDAALHFARVFTDAPSLTLHRTALASRTGAASFALDSAILRLSGPDLNSALTTRFGASATISLGNMQLLANAQINLGDLIHSLNDAQTTQPLNPAAILDGSTTTADLIAAVQSLLPVGLGNSLNGLANAAGTARFDLASLVGGIDTDLGLTATDFLSQINVSALDVVRAIVAARANPNGIALQTNVQVAGVLSTATTLTAGDPPAQSGLIALGETGVQLHHTAARLKSDIAVSPTLLGNLGIGIQAVSLSLPIYTEIAGSTATLTELGCNVSVPTDIAARFDTAASPLHPANGTALAALYLGHLPATAGPINPADLDFADLLTVNIVIDLPILPDVVIPGVVIQARSHIAVGTSQLKSLAFTQADVTAGRLTKGFGSGNLLTSAVSGLLSPANTELRVKPQQSGLIAGLAAPIVAGLLKILPDQLLKSLTAPVDAVLDATLGAAGVQLGAGVLTMTGHHCEPIRLVR